MDKVYKHQSVENKWYDFWEKSGYFAPKIDPGKTPFTIILPPPNANADLHLGHAMYVIEDILIRYYRMKGFCTLWLPGADHAGFETQYVFEKQLAKSDKSRFDYKREELFSMIWDFVQKNRGTMENQLRRLGFSLDWTRQVFTLDAKIVNIVYRTFKKLYDDGSVYRSKRLVNYCTKCGTGFSDLEVKYVERIDPLYYLKYGPFILATTRPETKFGDTAVAVNSKDKRYQKWIGKEIEVEGLLGKFKLKVIADNYVDPKFGTGVVKVTPAHDFDDFEVGLRHNLPLKQIIDYQGKLTKLTGPYQGLRVYTARKKVVEDLLNKGMIDHIEENYVHNVGTCYKCNSVIEPLPLPQWYIKIRPLADKAIEAIKDKEIVFYPKRFEKNAVSWLTNFHDWNISRQIVWGIQIPAWKCQECSDGIEKWIVTQGDVPKKCPECGSGDLIQDHDTFDTWFSSGQWPFATLRVNHKEDFQRFYPTSVMETGYDILPWWVCRMIMLGIYATGKVPFHKVCLHGLVRDIKGQKMSKSKGNTINPLDMANLYGADALRVALVYGTALGHDLPISEDKIRAMRNFSNKVWNIGRFLDLNMEMQKKAGISIPEFSKIDNKIFDKTDKDILSELKLLTKKVTKSLDNFRFDQAIGSLYEFIWHQFADKFIEESKEELRKNNPVKLAVLIHTYQQCLTLLHPFMPFITEEIYKLLATKAKNPLIISNWPK